MLNVDDGVGRSYYETHRRKQGVTPELLAKESLMTDRGAYLSFLEVQLERVSAACLTAQGFEERINGITEITHSSEEKVISLAKLVQLTNTCAEERSREVASRVLLPHTWICRRHDGVHTVGRHRAAHGPTA